MTKRLGCTRHFYIVCVHVDNDFAAARVYEHEQGDCDGEILCAACDYTSQQPGGWARLVPVLRKACSNCCRALLRAAKEARYTTNN
jgi:hypothetical protein